MNILEEQDLADDKGLTESTDSKISKKQKILVTKAIHPNLLQNIPMDVNSAVDLLAHLKAIYGSIDHLSYLKQLQNLRQIGLDPAVYIQTFDHIYSSFTNSGGSITAQMATLFLLGGLDPWYAPYSGPRQTSMRTLTVDRAFLEATKRGILIHYADTPKPATTTKAMLGTERAMPGSPTKSNGKFCQKCKDSGKRDYVIRSHHTKDHRDRPIIKDANKEHSNYTSSPIYDTAATSHFFTTKPDNYVRKYGSVSTASGETIKIKGSGTIQLGKVTLKNVQHVPEFTHDLVSGPMLLRDGFDQTISKDGKLVVSKDGWQMATGALHQPTQLIRFHTPISNSFQALTTDNDDTEKEEEKQQTLDINRAHLLWGHCAEAMLKRTATDQNIKLTGTLNLCPVCVTTKSNQKGKKRKSKKFTAPLAQVHSDLQGPYPIIAIDGTTSNIKFVDAATGYITMATIPDRTATTAALAYAAYKVRNELKTGKKILEVSTDGGGEFQGQFSENLKLAGTTHIIGDAHKHHLPPFAERANQTCQKFGRANLLQSKLPIKFYAEAQLYSIWILNRLVHTGQTKSPRELFHGKLPDLSKAVPFGQHAFTWVPAEKRHALANVRVPCRIIGFGEDDSHQEKKGYKIYVPSRNSMEWSNDVIVDWEAPMTPLSKEEVMSTADLDAIFTDPVYTPPEEELSETDDDEEYLTANDFSGDEDAFTQTKADPCIYIKDNLMVGIFVDDVFICGKDDHEISNFKTSVQKRFKMTDLGLLTWYLGMHFVQNPDSITIDQHQYTLSKLKQFRVGNVGCATPLIPVFQIALDSDSGELDIVFPYRSAVGSLIHLMRSTRPDIAVAVSVVSRYLDKPTLLLCNMVRRIFNYLAKNEYSLLYTRCDDNLELVGYSDASFANSEKSRSISGFAFLLSGSLISWYSHTQPVVALSTSEAEYMAVTDAAKEVIWLKLLLSELGYPQGNVKILEDNQATIKISKNPQDHKRTKHIQVKYHYIRDQIKANEFHLEYVSTQDQLADIFTKGLSGSRHRLILKNLGLIRRGSVTGSELKYDSGVDLTVETPINE
jgi:hypothetical protein